MRQLVSLFLVLFSSLSLYAQAEIVPISLGTVMPDKNKEVQLIDGATTSLSALKKENGIIIVFSSITCPFVVGGENYPGWEKTYNELYQLANENGIEFILINSNEAKRESGEGWNDLIERAKEKGYLMQTVFDKESSLANAFGAKTTPHVFFFDANEKLVYEGSIDNTWDVKRKSDIAYLSNAILALVNGNKINPAKTPAKGCSIKRQ